MAESELAERECIACTSADDPLTGDEIDEFYVDIDGSVWEVVDEHHLEGTYAFEDFRDALEFTYEVGELAEEEFHHPTITVRYEEVEIRFTSHEEGGITDADVEMAELTNDLR